MKYIRTKDKVYEDLSVVRLGSNAVIVRSGDIEIIVREADTIEELCDCFVEVRLGDPMIVTWDYVLHDDDRRNYDVYGAISTANGIIYVAKMNEKGELELL